MKKKRSDKCINESVVNIFNVGIQIDNDVPISDIQGLPEIFPFAFELFKSGEYLIRFIDVRSECIRNFNGVVGGTGIDHDDFIQQRITSDQFRFHDDDFFRNGFFFIQCRQAQGYGDVFPFLFFNQSADSLARSK